MCYLLIPKYYIKWGGTVLIQSAHNCVIHDWKHGVFTILTRYKPINIKNKN